MVGRDTELAVLAEATGSVAAGRARIVLVAGDAGVGKTRLLTEACLRAEERGVLCAVGGCVQLGASSLPYAPLVQALRVVRRRVCDKVFAELLGPAAVGVGALLGLSVAGGGQPGPVFEQVLGVLVRLAERQPTLLMLEDLHWADASTRDLVAFLGRNMPDVPLGIVLTYRSDELHRRHPWLTVVTELARNPRVDRIALAGLNSADLTAMLEGMNVGDVSVEELLQRTDGNPFYVEELIAAGGLGGPVPATLAEVILARVNDLPEPAPAVLHHAAALGEGIDDERLTELTGLPLADVTEALREAVSRHLLVVDSAGCRFRHALVREALYDDLLPGERERLHAAAARQLRHRSPRVPEHVRQTLLAHHAHAAGDLPTAFAAAVLAGTECERVSALADAAAHYERALMWWDQLSDPDRAAGMTRSELLLRAADAVGFSSLSPRAVALAEAALAGLPEGASPEQQVVVLERIWDLNLRLQRGPAATAAQQRAVALVAGRRPSPEKALALSAYGQDLCMRQRWREAEPVLREAITVAEQVDATAVRVAAASRYATALVYLGRLEEGGAAGVQALALARELGTTEDVCRAYTNLSASWLVCGRYDEAQAVAADGVAYALRTGHHGSRAVWMNNNRIEAMYLAGRWREAEPIEIQFCEQVPPTGGAAHGGWLNVLLGQGRVEEAKVILDATLHATEGSSEVQFRAANLLRAGELAELQGRWDEARDLLDQGLTLARDTDDQEHCFRGYASAVRVERRRVQALAGQRATAEHVSRARQVAQRRVEQARDMAGQLAAAGIDLFPGPAAWLQTAEAEFAATLDRDTPQLWAALTDAWQAVGQPYPVAVAHYRHAEALLRLRGDRDHARRAASTALQVAEHLAAAPLATEIQQLAQRGRLDLTPAPHPPPTAMATAATAAAGLPITPRETAVLSLLVTGRTNHEIARALYISDKTASVHVSNLVRKLGAANRVEAAAIAQRLGLTGATTQPDNRTPPAPT